MQLADKAQHYLEKVDSVKSYTAKANNCEKALRLLEEADIYPECREIISDYDKLTSRLNSIIKVLPVVGHIEKAYRYQFKGKEAAEKNALLDALYEIRTNEISNEDFWRAEVLPEGTGEIIEIETIESRLKELGWEG